MLSNFETENYSKIVQEMSDSKLVNYQHKANPDLTDYYDVYCVNGESRFLESVQYLYFQLSRKTTNFYREAKTIQFVVLKADQGDDEARNIIIYCNGSFLHQGPWIKDCIAVLGEAYANFREEIAKKALNKACNILNIDEDYSTHIPEDIKDAFAEVAPGDSIDSLRLLKNDIKVFEQYIGL